MDEIEILRQKIFEHLATSATADKAKAARDDWFAHWIYFIHDALWFCEFEHGVSHGDAGCVIRVFKYWAFAFRDAGQHNYARECAEVLVNGNTSSPLHSVQPSRNHGLSIVGANMAVGSPLTCTSSSGISGLRSDFVSTHYLIFPC
jgi:hypothetical protein